MLVALLTHTHWDREWYQPLGRFRQRLVALVDEVLDDPPREGASFLLDGQAIAVEDYLAVRPERRDQVAGMLRDGRLEAGPWYVLADNLIPGGEALVRNLLAGRRTLAALGATAPPPVLYCPDSFGHPAVMPSLAAGFGFETAIVWRGYGGARWPAGDAAWWQGADGTRVLLHHLPPDGYEFGSNLPSDPAAARDRWSRMRAVLASRARLGVMLVQNGADHHARQTDYTKAVAALGDAAHPHDEVVETSLAAFAADLRRRAESVELPSVQGELRDSTGYTWSLQGTFGTRAYQKRSNAIVERTLVRDAEPWAAIARARGGASMRPHRDAAWRGLLACHPHDTLCGCSLDAVARAADARWDDARVQAEGIRTDAIDALIGRDGATARDRRAEWRSTLAVRNAAPRPRGGVARVTLDTFVADVGVGPGSAGQRIRPATTALPSAGGLPVQVLGASFEHARLESPRHYPDDDLVERRDALVWMPEVPAYGLRCIALDAEPAPATAVAAVTRAGDALTNGIVTIALDGAGDISVRDAASKGRVESLLAFECLRDEGDLYTPAVRGARSPVRVLDARVTAAGPLRGIIAIDCEIESQGPYPPTRAVAEVSIDAGSSLVRVAVRGEHHGADQRLRVLLATGVAPREVWADAAFGPVSRPVGDARPRGDAREAVPRTDPLHRYVSVFPAPEGACGATVYSDGLAEYEAMDDGRIAVTLVRAVGELSRDELPERPGHAGWPSSVPQAQCRGPFEAHFALLLHAAVRDAATIAAIEEGADDALLPLVGETVRDALETPGIVHGLAIEGDGLALSALAESDDGTALVLRIVNLLATPTPGAVRVGWRAREWASSRLDETVAGTWTPVAGDVIPLALAPREIATILVR